MSTQHTPGPWEVKKGAAMLNSVCTVYGTEDGWVDIAAPIPMADDYRAESSANARLIAAAPDLLEALKSAVDTLTDPRIGQWSYMEGSEIYSDFKDAADAARAAIAKATGGAQ